MKRKKFDGIAWGAVLILAVCLAACSPSPHQELSHLQNQLSSLQSVNPHDFLQKELSTIHASLQQIEHHLKTQNLDLANQRIDEAKALIKQAQSMYAMREQTAKEYSLEFIVYVNFHIDSASAVIRNMPHRTFVDQNRRDIARFRLRAAQEQANKLQQAITEKRYFKAFSETTRTQSALNELLQYVNLSPLDWNVFRASSQQPATKLAARQQTSLAKMQ